MVLEFCPGGVLMDVSLNKTATPLAIEEARRYFQQLVLGIEYCTSRLYFICDVADENADLSSVLPLVHENDIAHRGESALGLCMIPLLNCTFMSRY